MIKNQSHKCIQGCVCEGLKRQKKQQQQQQQQQQTKKLYQSVLG